MGDAVTGPDGFPLAADDTRWKKLPKRAAIDHLAAILQRLTVDRLRLIRLLRVLYAMKRPCTERDLCTLLELTAPLLSIMSPEGPVEDVLECSPTMTIS